MALSYINWTYGVTETQTDGGGDELMDAKAIQLTDVKLNLIRQRMGDFFVAGRSSWCFACGAGAKALKELLATNPDSLRELVSEEAIGVAFSNINIDDIKGKTSWCFACGAGAKSMDETRINPPIDMDLIIRDVVQILES